MNISELFTTDGFCAAIKRHHNLLSDKYNFPPLKGMKPVHKMAETFGYPSAEPFIAALNNLQPVTSFSLNTSIMLSDTQPQIIHIEYEESDSTLRVMFESQPAYMMITMRHDSFYRTKSVPIIYDIDETEVLVHMGEVCLHLTAKPDGIGTDFYESRNNKVLPIGVIPEESDEVELIESAFELFEKQGDATQEDTPLKPRTVFVAVEKQEGRLYSSAHNTFDEAVNHFIGEIKEDIEDTLDYLTIAVSLNIEGAVTWTEEQAQEKLSSMMNNMAEKELELIYQCIHGSDSMLQISSSTLTN